MPPLSLMKLIAEDLKKDLEKRTGSKVFIVGSVRRQDQNPNDIDMLLTSNTNLETIKSIEGGPKRYKMMYKSVKVDLFVTPEEDLPFAMLHFTGSKLYNIRLRAKAKTAGYLLNQYGLFRRDTGKKVNRKFNSEYDIIKFIGGSYRTAKERNLKYGRVQNMQKTPSDT